MVEVSLFVFMIASVSLALGVTIQGTIGFGANLIASPIMFLADPDLLPGPLLTAGLVMAAVFAGRERRHGSWVEVATIMVGRVPGAVLGVLALGAISVSGIGVLFGVLLLTAVGLSVSGWRVGPSRLTLATAGLVSGFTATVVAVGGPPVAVVYQRSSGPDVRANMSRVLFLGTIVSLGVLAVAGRYGVAELLTGLALLPAGAVGFFLARWTRNLVDVGYTRHLVLTVSAASAIAVIVRSLI